MKNNKGFAITATIYGFLILFLIILLSVLSVMRSQNNRSITISEKIENKLFPVNEEVVSKLEPTTEFTAEKNGKYYIRIFGTEGPSTDYFTYIPKNKKLTVKDGKLEINGNDAIIYDGGKKITISNDVEEFVIVKYITPE